MRIVQELKKSIRRAQNLVRHEVPSDPEILLPLADPVLAIDRGGERPVELGGQRCLLRTYRRHPAAQACLGREVLARELFKGKPWLIPIARRQGPTLVLPRLPEDARLDRIAARLGATERAALAEQALAILFDLFAAGWAHREFDARHLYVSDGQLMLANFEVMEAYPARSRPAFLDCPDIKGFMSEEADSGPKRPFFDSLEPDSARSLLGVSAAEAFPSLRESLRRALHDTSTTFHKYGGRHVCSARRTYGSFTLPLLSVDASVAQRDSARRLENFGIRRADIEGATILDLGSNIGAMSFELQRFRPARTLGVEYDRDKVMTANRVAALHGLADVTFIPGDIDALTLDTVGETFDVVLSLAIEGHVADPKRLFRLLADVTRRTLYFEGNITTDIEWVQENLRQHGFSSFEKRGLSDDDCEPTNRNRPLLVACKSNP